jgi:hypothetical protein
MKVIKLDRRYKAFAQGFTHALKFQFRDRQALEVETILRDRYVYNGFDPAWQSHTGKRVPVLLSYSYPAREWWIDLRHESDITLILLMVDH